MSSFEPAVEVVLSEEGLYSKSPSDPGGETKYGITLKTYLRAQELFPQFRNTALKDLTVDGATFIYQKMFWDIYPYSEIDNQMIANKLFSLAINMGEHEATICLQRALNSINHIKIQVDGEIGSLTISAVNASDSTALLNALRYEAELAYKAIVIAKPELQKDLHGLLNRADA